MDVCQLWLTWLRQSPVLYDHDNLTAPDLWHTHCFIQVENTVPEHNPETDFVCSLNCSSGHAHSQTGTKSNNAWSPCFFHPHIPNPGVTAAAERADGNFQIR